MTSPSESKTTSGKLKPVSQLCVLAAMMLLSVSLTSCATVSPAPKESLQLFQPRVLRLEAGREVVTRDGLYRPQTDEVWHSDGAYLTLEKQAIDLAAALAQLQPRTQ
jgi:hypothetical protein